MTSHDLEALERLLDRDTVRRMAEIFCQQWRLARPEFSDVSTAANLEALRRKAHDLVTSAGSLGFADLADQARQMEQALLKSDFEAAQSLMGNVIPLANDATASLNRRYGPF